MSQFHLPAPWKDALIEAPISLAHHLRVRRIRPEEIFRVFDGQGTIAQAKISSSSTDKRVVLELSEIRKDASGEPNYPVVLFQGLPSSEKMDWIIEKVVELGVTKIVPIQTSRSVVRLDQKRAEKRHAHWQALIIAASEQSHRTILPHLSPVLSFESALTLFPTEGTLPILLTPRADMSLISIAKRAPGQGISLLIGPEGGFSDEEESAALQKGALQASLGNRVLRTETAGIVAMSAVHTLWGGF